MNVLARSIYLYPGFTSEGSPRGNAILASAGIPIRIIQTKTLGRGRNKVTRYFIETTAPKGWGQFSIQNYRGWVDADDIAEKNPRKRSPSYRQIETAARNNDWDALRSMLQHLEHGKRFNKRVARPDVRDSQIRKLKILLLGVPENYMKKNPRKLRISRRGEKIGEFRMTKAGGRDPRRVKRVIRRLYGRGVSVNPRKRLKKLNVELKKESGYWSVYVNGIRTVDRESFAVADSVKRHLENPGAYNNSESSEVADSIRKYFNAKKNPGKRFYRGGIGEIRRNTEKYVRVQVQRNNQWTTFALFPTGQAGTINAKAISRRLHRKYPTVAIRVIT